MKGFHDDVKLPAWCWGLTSRISQNDTQLIVDLFFCHCGYLEALFTDLTVFSTGFIFL